MNSGKLGVGTNDEVRFRGRYSDLKLASPARATGRMGLEREE